MTRGTVAAQARRVAPPTLALPGLWRRLAISLGVLVTVVFIVSPILYLGILSITSQGEVLSGRILPERPVVENWRITFSTIPLWRFLRNSLITATASSLLTLALSFPLAYAVVRLRIGGQVVPTVVLASYTTPPIVAAIPLFFLLRRLELINSVFGLTLVYAAANVPVAFYLLDNFLLRIPEEIEEAAWLDGAGTLRALAEVVLPLALPGLTATGIICGILAYNEFLFALLFTYSPVSQTLPVAISLFQGDKLVQFGQMAVASLVGMVPVYALGTLLQRWLIGGLTGGIK